MSKYQIQEQEVNSIEQEFRSIAEEFGERAALDRVSKAADSYHLGIFRMVVVGEIKKGKSSFINALLGTPEVVPTGNDITTSTVFKIMYGNERKYRVFFLPEDPSRANSAKAPMDIDAGSLAEYGTEDGNPDNAKRVDFIAALLPHPLLKSGLIIVDTPGLGGVFQNHASITWRYAPNADAVFFVLDSYEAVASREEMDALQRLRRITPYLFFVQTKTDLVCEEQSEAWKRRNLDIISEAVSLPSGKLIYLPVSSTLKLSADKRYSPRHLERSGFAPVLHLLNFRLIVGKHHRQALRMLSLIAQETDEIRRRLSDELRVFAASSAADLDRLEQRYQDVKGQFELWRRTGFRKRLTQFEEQLDQLVRNANEEIEREFDPEGAIVESIVVELRSREGRAEDIANESVAIKESFTDRCGERSFAIEQRLHHGFIELLSDIAGEIGRSKEEALTPPDKAKLTAPARQIETRHSVFDTVRSGFMGSSAGGFVGGIAGTVIAAAAAVVFPPLGLATAVVAASPQIGMAIGGAFGLIRGIRDHRVRAYEDVLRELRATLAAIVRSAHRIASRHLADRSRQFRRVATRALEENAQDTEKELREKLKAITEARQQSGEENKQRAALLQKRIARVDALADRIRSCIEPPETAAAREPANA